MILLREIHALSGATSRIGVDTRLKDRVTTDLDIEEGMGPEIIGLAE